MNILCKLHLHKFYYRYFKEYFNNEHFREYENRGGFNQSTYRSCVRCGLNQFIIGFVYEGKWTNTEYKSPMNKKNIKEFDGEYSLYDDIPV